MSSEDNSRQKAIVNSNIMKNKIGIVMGVANDRSLAWGVTKALSDNGADIILTYQGEALKKRIVPLADKAKARDIFECDVSEEESIKSTFDKIHKKYGKIDFIVHAIAYSDKEELKGKYIETTRNNFLQSMDISCYSFTSVANYASKIMNDGGSMLTLSYYGAEKVIPHYNVMGIAKAALEASVMYLAADLGNREIRVNGISAGPVKTLAASGIGDFRYILKWNEYNAPLKRNTNLDDVGGAALFLLSNLSSGTTGEIVHVDSGYHVVGMKSPDAPDISVV
ncbi:MAG: Enoyl-[acyl-carrier-protein] reductase [NADH] FabI [Alphaproteobacteria bacterium MarineAlpha9_Bin3]|nr:MAG: Enoyl-[acyl-carrier-protein] reductase [NADH] FabI [Alphaproteobacteria bacterium MarineAlpha9_Bin3]|tara:strand:- start:31595 stop:32437 length:843 start_codon:yes stop_codon:yes gene_type:complete